MAFEYCAALDIKNFVEDFRLNRFEKAPNAEDGIVSSCKECNLSQKALLPVPKFSGNTYSDMHYWFLLALNCEFRNHLHIKKTPEDPPNVVRFMREMFEAADGKTDAEEAKEKIEWSEEEKFRILKSFALEQFEIEHDNKSEAESSDSDYDSEPEPEHDSEPEFDSSEPEYDSEFEFDSSEPEYDLDEPQTEHGSASAPVFALAAAAA